MTVFARYAVVLRGRGTAWPLVASVVGRLSLGMTGLALLLLVRETSGSYAQAGAVAAAYALAFGAFGPSRARSADRSGPVPALLLTAAVHPPALLALVLLALGGAPLAALLAVAVVAGASVPPLGPVMRALWGSKLTGPELATAYSLEAVVVELCFVLGPLLVAGLAVLTPGAGVATAAGLAAVGAVWLALTPAVRAVAPHPDAPRARSGPLGSATVRRLLLTVAGVGVGFGAIEVAMPAYAEVQGSRPAAAGLLLAVWSAGSIVGGLLYGGLHVQAPHARQLPWLVTAMAIGTALPLLAQGPVTMGLALFLYGLTIAPFSACNSVLLGAAAPAGTATEAFAWNGSMIFGGAALGSGLAGVLVERSGPFAALTVTAVAGGLTLLAARLPRPVATAS